jgi:hypothetical protein
MSVGRGSKETQFKPTHGLTATIVYRRYVSMMHRCYDSKASRYERYGGRGIRVCDRWLQSVENFVADMGHPTPPADSLDRIDNDGNYEPSNCRWVTLEQQQRNTSRNVFLTIESRTLCVMDVARELGVSPQTIYSRLKRGLDPFTGYRDGRTKKGMAKLTNETARAIREATGPQWRIAKAFGVCQMTVSDVKRGLLWRNA